MPVSESGRWRGLVGCVGRELCYGIAGPVTEACLRIRQVQGHCRGLVFLCLLAKQDEGRQGLQNL